MAVKTIKPAKLALVGAAMIGVALPAVASAQWHQREDYTRGEERRGHGDGAQAPQAAPARQAPAPQPMPQGDWASRPAPAAAPAPQGGWAPRPAPVQNSAPPPQGAGGGWNGRGNWAGRPVPPAPQAAPAPAPAPNAEPSPRAWGYAQRGSAPPPQPGHDRNDWVNRGTAGVPHYSPRDGERWRDGERGRDGDRWRDAGRGHDRDGWRGADTRRWNHDWRRDNRYDWRGWRNDHRDWFHLGRYYPPYRGWYYRRLTVGFVLDSLFWGSDSWIADPYYYRLPPAYGPYRWVRYFDDALLVDTYSGQVIDVIYGVFW